MMKAEVEAGYKLIAEYHPSRSLLSLPFTTPETIHKRISWMRYHNYTYSQINALDEFSEVPPGTIQVMYESPDNYVPKKHWKFLRCRAGKPRERATVSTKDMQSAADTLIEYLGHEPEKLQILVSYLDFWLASQ